MESENVPFQESGKADIRTYDDIRVLVDRFYERVRADDLLGDIFEQHLAGKWEPHLEKMYRFWQTMLLNEHTYYGSPFHPHASMPITAHHFNRWEELFKQTVDELFCGMVAEDAKNRALRMSLMFQSKLAHYREIGGHPIV
ncbi:MAG: group III truncated hemoglobin [Flavobacteriales bacterium]|nr:group III truncated hemoglobin [Flavobacteriales bacterium]